MSLLFQLAVSYASKELSVTFICQKPLSTLPRCVHGMPQPDAKTLSTLKFLYVVHMLNVYVLNITKIQPL